MIKRILTTGIVVAVLASAQDKKTDLLNFRQLAKESVPQDPCDRYDLVKSIEHLARRHGSDTPPFRLLRSSEESSVTEKTKNITAHIRIGRTRFSDEMKITSLVDYVGAPRTRCRGYWCGNSGDYSGIFRFRCYCVKRIKRSAPRSLFVLSG